MGNFDVQISPTCDDIIKVIEIIKASSVSSLSNNDSFWDAKIAAVEKKVASAQTYIAFASVLTLILVRVKKAPDAQVPKMVEDHVAALRELKFYKVL